MPVTPASVFMPTLSSHSILPHSQSPSPLRLLSIPSINPVHARLSAKSRLIMMQEKYEGVFKRFRTDRLERELQMVQLSASKCSRIAILWVSLVSFATVTLSVASQQVFIVTVVYFVIDSVRKLLDTLSYDGRIICSFMDRVKCVCRLSFTVYSLRHVLNVV